MPSLLDKPIFSSSFLPSSILSLFLPLSVSHFTPPTSSHTHLSPFFLFFNNKYHDFVQNVMINFGQAKVSVS